MSKLPDNHSWVKFKHKEWLTYGAFQKLTRTVRCYWVDLFSLSYSCDKIGHLQINGKPLTNQEIAKSISSSKREFESALKKLIEVGLCKISSNGTIIIPQVLELYDENNLRKSSNNAAKSLRNPCEITRGNGGNQPKTTTQEKEEDKDIREDKKEKSVKKENQDLIDGQRDVSPNGSTKKGSRLPDDWMPTENDIAYAQNLNLDPEKIAEDFCDWWHAKAGAGARKTDWSLTWKTWCRRENEKNQEKQQRFNAYNQPRKSNLERIGEKIDRAAEHYGVDDWFENGVPQDLSTKPKLQLVGGSKW
ncbi:hypothetical protein CIN_21450 [Commensalibacter intestini A911]|uniref:Bacteriophage lambda Replication protein O N-terminal domain-containing protein n=1 Tax=Commensalibacter intestini A911 TaxID=1088868 RepID=G6F3E9_9PROT|nr:hypothetical protein [Commensalibacter intestini]EHD12899.1 hypothetical protein CIN_21450 [Commensalibacter intestini A911]